MKQRASILFFIICLVFTGLYLWLGILANDPTLRTSGEVQSVRTITVLAERGTIYDCHLTPITNNTDTYLAVVIPTEESIALLEGHSDQTATQLDDYLESGEVFTCYIDTPTLASEQICVFPVSVTTEQLATHIVGYLDGESNGVNGIQAAYNDLLSQSPYTISYRVDATGRAIQFTGITESDSLDQGVVLTIDSAMQEIVETAGSALAKGAVVVMEVDTGKIRAMASFPNYSIDAVADALQDENGALLNRTITPYAVGSAFKVVTLADALVESVPLIEENECTGSIAIGTNLFHCHKREGHGTLNAKQALMASCNPYFIKLGQNLTPERFLQTANDCGFGKQTTLAPNLVNPAGTLPTVDELSVPAGLANFSFGQGTFTATPITLAQMMSTVANDGLCPTPILVEGETDGSVLPQQAASVSRAFSADIADVLQDMLYACLNEQTSTATPTLTTAAGKTSTAETGRYQDGVQLNDGWFVGYFPAENPQYAVAIVAEDAVSGSTNAAPVFREIADGITALPS